VFTAAVVFIPEEIARWSTPAAASRSKSTTSPAVAFAHEP
jgi:hypothetical protein